MESDELFDYISDLPSDNVLEICNFVLIGGNSGETSVATEPEAEQTEHVDNAEHFVSVGTHEHAQELSNTSDNSYAMAQFNNNNFVGIMDYQTENNNNDIDRNKSKVCSICILSKA